MSDRNALLACAVVWSWLALVACSSDHADGTGNEAGKPAGSSGGSGGSGGGSAGNSVGGAGAATAGVGGASAGKGGSAAGGKGGAGAAGKGGAGASGGAGLPASAWVNATDNLAGMQSECGNLTLLSATPNSKTIIAGVAKGGLFASDDGGSWTPLGTGAGSAVITNRPSSIVYDPDDEKTFWESGIYNGGGVYKTTDAGQTFAQLGDIGHNDLVSVDFSDPQRKTLLVGGHEQKQTLYLSTDGGMGFTQIGGALPSGSHFSSAPLVLDSKTFLLGACGYGDGTCGVFRSVDAGQQWEQVSDLAVAARPLWAADDSIYWSTIYDSGMARGTDQGTAWTKPADNLVTSYPVELPDGRILTLRGDHVVVSADQGVTWDQVGDPLPFKASGVTYSVQGKKLYVWHWDCGDIVLPDAIASAGFDYTQN